MKNVIIFMLLGVFLSCTKQLIVEPVARSGQDKENTKLEITKVLGEKKISLNKYNVIIIDHLKKSKIEYPVPKDKKWVLPVNFNGVNCFTLGEEVGTKDFFLMELSCGGKTEFTLASVVACGPNNTFDAETMRVLKNGTLYLTLQLQCSY
ncbi:MAG: hypothetical protein E2O68_00760 [Deltaproteobacteria bacterium]|nr:MAG: hypothetical protein E2O68_00760 [Deltaproteobacteria bacterium]